MPHNYTITDQVNFLVEWFDSWSEFQKEDFLPVLVQALNPGENVNGLVEGVRSIEVGGQRRPSLFNCQIKLFHEWIDNWSEAEKNQFLEHIKTNDPDFNEKLNNGLIKEPQKIEEETTTISRETSLPSSIIAENEKDDGINPGSPSVSPLSSVSQPQSPHDSGMDENHSDIEVTSQHVTSVTQENSGSIEQDNVPSSKQDNCETDLPANQNSTEASFENTEKNSE